MPTRRRLARSLAAAALIAALPPSAHAQATRPAAARACTPVVASRGPALVIGHVGGNLRPDSTLVYADGRVVRADAPADSAAQVDTLAVRAVARLARTGGFWATLAPTAMRPTRNPDAARDMVLVHLSCGTRRLVFPPGAAPAAFAELHALVAALVRQ